MVDTPQIGPIHYDVHFAQLIYAQIGGRHPIPGSLVRRECYIINVHVQLCISSGNDEHAAVHSCQIRWQVTVSTEVMPLAVWNFDFRS